MTRPASQQFRFVRRPNVARNTRIVELYTAGLSSVEVGNRIGMTSTNVQHVLRKAGVQLRTPAEARRLGKQRAERRQLIAEAAQRHFGYLRAPGVTDRDIKPANVPPVNPGFADEVLEPGWEDSWP